MKAEAERLIDSALTRLSSARKWLARLSRFSNWATFRIKRGAPAQTIEAVSRGWTLSHAQRRKLLALGASPAGAAFIDQQVESINRAAFHRSAFVLNAFTQLLFVDLAAQISMSAPQLKLALVAANLALAGLAHAEMRQNFRALLAGPLALPKRRRLRGLVANRRYNRAVKSSSRAYARVAWKEKSLYRAAYFFNAATIFLGSQFIVPPQTLIFPFGFLVGKISGLCTAIVVIFDLWRGYRAGVDARLAQEREVAVYRNLDF